MQAANLQKAVFQALSNSPALTQIVGNRIYDYEAQDVAYPHIVIGELDTNDWSVKNVEGQEHLITLHIWSRRRGKLEAHTICDHIYSALHNQALNLGPGALIKIRLQRNNVFTDADGITTHAVMDFIVWTTEG